MGFVLCDIFLGTAFLNPEPFDLPFTEVIILTSLRRPAAATRVVGYGLDCYGELNSRATGFIAVLTSTDKPEVLVAAYFFGSNHF
jgi:hypothetical protein